MEKTISAFQKYLKLEGKSEQTISSYVGNIKEYCQWLEETFESGFLKLFRENVLEFKSYLKNVKKYRGRAISAKTINLKLSALKKFNEFLVEEGIQEHTAITNKDLMKVQGSGVNPAKYSKQDMDKLRQAVLLKEDKRMYCLLTLMAYTGIRISEALSIKLYDVHFDSDEILIRNGKGEKQRTVYMNTKVSEAMKSYLSQRKRKSEYLFSSRQSDKVDRTVVNKQLKKYSKEVTPHDFRHHFCSHALDNGFAIHEVAAIVGHKSVYTTLRYTSPSMNAMKEKIERL